MAEDLKKDWEKRSHEEKVEKVATNLGMSGASEEEVRQALEKKLEEDEKFRQIFNEHAKNLDLAVNTLEATVAVADYTIVVGEAALGPAGKAVSATYHGAKGLGTTVAEKGLSAGSVTEGLIKGGTDAVSTMLDAGITKTGVIIGGTVAGQVAEAINEGKDVASAAAEGLMKGAASGAVSFAADSIEGLKTDSLVHSVTTKIGEKVVSDNIVNPSIDDLIKNKD